MGKSFIAIDLTDFHDKSKKWQGGGNVDTVKIRVLGGRNLEQAKRLAKSIDPGNAWYVFPLDTLRSMVYADAMVARTYPPDMVPNKEYGQ